MTKPYNKSQSIFKNSLQLRFQIIIGNASLLTIIICILGLTLASPTFAGQKKRLINDRHRARRADHVGYLKNKHHSAKDRAKKWGRKHKKRIRHESSKGTTEIVDIKNGTPVILTTYNLNAAISTAVTPLQNPSTWNLDGSGLTVGLWDAGSALHTHQEFGSRVTVKDNSGDHYHSTHAGGTLGASGVVPAATGMATNVQIDSYDWSYDTSEMAARAADSPDDTDKLFASNHSYGHVAGWQWANWAGTNGWHWNSSTSWNGSNTVESTFGQYDYTAATYDSIAYSYPYYLIFKSAGNDRSNSPSTNDTVYYSTNNGVSWQSIKYNISTCAPGDGVYKNGYDTIPTTANAKNIMVVGSVNDAVYGGNRSASSGTMSSYSSWGPTDDGRIKPDIVANGQSLYSTYNSNNSSYASLSGTSMASPNACGSAILLIQLYRQLFANDAMASSTLKALMIHTADDLGNPGPDYKNGWGLINTLTAAEIIQNQYDNPGNKSIIEDSLSTSNTIDTYSFQSDGISSERFTLCWTDPPGTSISTHDSTSPRLVNDLDIRISNPGNTVTYFPWKLDPTNPNTNATTGDNTLDNVEQIYLPILPPGPWNVHISFKNSLSYNQQAYSLIVSISPEDTPPIAYDSTVSVLSNSTTSIELLADDDEKPAPLYWTITSLPQNGTLADPINPSTIITSVPYILANGNNIVNYTPISSTSPSDQFTFTANDSGTPPSGGISNSAVITIDIIDMFFSENFDSNPNWTTEGQWQFGQPLGSGGEDHGNPDPTYSFTGQNIYGYNLAGDYTDSMQEHYLTTLPIDCSIHTDVTLRFFRWLNVERPAYDHASIQVSNDNQNWTTIWENSTEITDDQWVLTEYNISQIADAQPTVYIQWVMGATDSSWKYSGWNIDDVALLGHIRFYQLPDLQELATHWLRNDCSTNNSWCNNADLDRDSHVNLVDLCYLAARWLQ